VSDIKRNALGSKIVQLRQGKGISQVRLANACQMDPGNLSKIETGANPFPRKETLEKIAGALEVSVSDLPTSTQIEEEVIAAKGEEIRLHRQYLAIVVKALGNAEIDELSYAELKFLCGIQSCLTQPMSTAMAEELLKKNRHRV